MQIATILGSADLDPQHPEPWFNTVLNLLHQCLQLEIFLVLTTKFLAWLVCGGFTSKYAIRKYHA